MEPQLLIAIAVFLVVFVWSLRWKPEREVWKFADVQFVEFKSSTDHTPDKTDPPVIQVQNRGTGIAFDVWAEIQMAAGGPVERSGTIAQIDVGQTRELVGRHQSFVTAPSRQFSKNWVQARCGWKDDARESTISGWVLYQRE